MPNALVLWQQAETLYRSGPDASARASGLYRQLTSDPAWALPAHLRLSWLAQANGQLRAAVEESLAALGAGPDQAVLAEALMARLFDLGELQAGLSVLEWPQTATCRDPQVLLGIARLLTGQSFNIQAQALLERARAAGANGPQLDYLSGLNLLYAGEMDRAEQHLLSCVRQGPGFAPAWRMLARVRHQTAQSNHVDRLRTLITSFPRQHPDLPVLYYALFKELDDLDDRAAAWHALDTGMRLRRAQVHYQADADAQLFAALRQVARSTGDNTHSAQGSLPIFIVGLPRSGTTLLERILSGHHQVTDAGELRDLVAQLRWVLDLPGGPHPDLALTERASAAAPWAMLGERYLAHTAWRANGTPWFTDKLPENYLALGWALKSLPQARVLHLTRDPMDVCFSNLKELFADAYSHSYDQREMGQHYLGYRRLMAHWHATFPGRILDVSYEQLATSPDAVARSVLAFCGLEWDPAVLALQARAGSVPTASTAQVREPVHGRYIGQWQRYAPWLGTLKASLEADAP